MARGSSPHKDIYAWAEQKFDPLPITYKLELLHNLITLKNLKINPVYGINDHLDAKGIRKLILEMSKQYCEIMYPGINCKHQPVGCGLTDDCAVGNDCVAAKNKNGFQCVMQPKPTPPPTTTRRTTIPPTPPPKITPKPTKKKCMNLVYLQFC